MARLKEVGDAVERSHRPVAGRDRRRCTPAPVGQFRHGVGAVQLEQLVVACEQDCQCTVSLHQLMDDAHVVGPESAGRRVDPCPALARANATVLVNDAIRCDQGKASRQVQRRVLSIQPEKTWG